MNRRTVDTPREWAAYVRVSDTRGREGDSFHSPDQQEQAIRRATDEKVVKVFTDLDRSGTNMNRPALQEMLAWLREEPTRRGVGVYDYSRLSRRMRDMLDLADEITRMGSALMSVKENMDTSTPSGEHMFHQFASMYHLQARMIGERWSDVQQRRVEAGLDPGGPARFGYRKVTDKSTQVQQIDPVMGPILAQMYRDYIGGQGMLKITQRLNERGILKRRKNPKPWSISTVTRTMDSGWGAGFVMTRSGDGVEFHQGKHDPLITPEEWEAYKRERDLRRKRHPKLKSPRWFLAGITKCGHCGGGIMVNSYIAVKSQAMCSNYKLSRGCTGVWINRVFLERRVGYWLGGQIDAWADHAQTRDTAEGERTAIAREAQRAEDEMRRIRESKIELLKMRSRGDMTEDEYRAVLGSTEADARRVGDAYEAARARLEALQPLDDVYERIARSTKDMDSAEWNSLLSRLIDRIEVTKQTVTIYPHRGETVVHQRSRKDHLPRGGEYDEARYGPPG